MTPPTPVDIDTLEAHGVELKLYLHHDRSEMNGHELESLCAWMDAAPHLLAIAKAVRDWRDGVIDDDQMRDIRDRLDAEPAR